MWIAAGNVPNLVDPAEFDRGDNALWMRRHWMHEDPTAGEIAALAESLRAHGIRRIYPFLGPMDREGWPGWRSKAGLVRYAPERAGRFLAEMRRIAPEIRVMPWTGGILDRDVNLKDAAQRKGFAEHARRLVEAGADGVHLNIEPVASGSPDYLAFLREVKAAIGPRTLSVAAFPPPIPSQPDAETHWDLPFLREVCRSVNEIAVMAYDTGLTSAPAFEAQIAVWTRTSPPRSLRTRLAVANGSWACPRLMMTPTITGPTSRRSSTASTACSPAFAAACIAKTFAASPSMRRSLPTKANGPPSTGSGAAPNPRGSRRPIRAT